jgi:hypothetical protein
MTTISWISTTGGDWSVASNWQGGVVPGTGDDAIMNLSDNETITISSSVFAQSVLFDDPAATYVVTASGDLSAGTNLELDGNSITVNGTLAAGANLTLSMSDGMDLSIDARLIAGDVISVQIGDSGTGTFALGGTLQAGPPGSPAAPVGMITAGTVTPGNGTIGVVSATGLILTGGTVLPGVIAVVSGGTITSAGSLVPSCFASGTHIETPDGDRRVETLSAGDHVTLHDGQTAAIIWIGHRHVDCRHHPAPDTVRPVRVRLGAFGYELPRRDLMLSPDHAVYVRGVLVPIRYLINGTSIVQEAWDTVEYFHVELQAHDIILAEGLPVESYLETGHRAAFDNAGPVTHLHPRFAPAIREAFGCAASVVSGPVLDLIRHDLDQRPVPLTPETSPATWAQHRA